MAKARQIPKGAGRGARSPGGFTLIEVMVAVVIFGIAASALMVTFRQGIRSWEAAHTASEMYQTARIAEDVILRDLGSLAYIQASDLNQTFMGQVAELARFEEWTDTPEDLRTETTFSGGAFGSNDQISLDGIASPLDMSFHGEDAGELDTISFSRHQSSIARDDVESWGLQRVTYYVEDGILYRDIGSAFGFRPSEDQEEIYENEMDQERVTKLFYRAGERPGDDALDSPPARDTFTENFESLLPDSTSTAEPLCVGVEIFNITYGYFRFEQWNEVDGWDSGAYSYRFPRDEQDELFGNQDFDAQGRRTETSFRGRGRQRSATARTRDQTLRFTIRPDNLPGYVAIQLGLRAASGRGRLRSFTFFASLPLAREELDTTLIDDSEGANLARPTSGRSNGNDSILSSGRR